ncbi:hypothetical protein B0T21DRAFT_370704 [Apiosordaria backusii]|uniref:Tr-type G domain-containing protein n=1 Tax=Apiosordaria backusii TaxID=314023 RepID=A0AA40B7V4_9PEZI|nr:hypothetical protein B0T21DRAFT_370704 [Apiosordaria backusii]
MSVFTFDPLGSDPARASSPWLRPTNPHKKPSVADHPTTRKGTIGSGLLSDYGVTKLEPEPQDGPTEYKLHLLLRSRRKYEHISTATRISGSSNRPAVEPRSARPAPAIPGCSTTTQTRQDRLEHLTTQLLWRLQQSCPYHSGTATTVPVIPQLPNEKLARDAPIKLGKLLPGLEASRGALYEIGVADDGTLAGLTKDELDESLNTLRIMAASLGCNMKVLRKIAVGDCEWIESSDSEQELIPGNTGHRRQAKLWVAEALVTPDLRPRNASHTAAARSTEGLPDPTHGPLSTDQLRVTLTGPTTSGKSTLLGALSTGTLDNGRGKGRLGLLKHLHEVASGITSSVTQELVGYDGDKIVNYAHQEVESWIDIHNYTKSGRLVYLVDSAGHPKYRRTILRGIVGWAPNWTLLCIAANSYDMPALVEPATDVFGPEQSMELASAHLDLCLRLRLPLVVVMTKLDLATVTIKKTLSRILSKIKQAGRVPMLVKSGPAGHSDLSVVSDQDAALVKDVTEALRTNDDPSVIVPIVLTSAVDGRGIGSLHALIRSLPVPPTPTSHDFIGAALNPEQPACLFHVEDKYSLPASCALATSDTDQQTDLGTVVAGYLRFGSLSIGDKVVVGPFPSEDIGSPRNTPRDQSPAGSYGLSLSQPSSAELSRIAARNAVSASAVKGEWHTASIVSIHNLRLPVQTLSAGQVGSIGIIFDQAKSEDGHPSTTMPRLRKGMVLAVPSQHMVSSGLSLQAVSGLTAVFDRDNAAVSQLTVGSLVNIYVASVRTVARMSRVSRLNTSSGQNQEGRSPTDDVDDVFGLGGDDNMQQAQSEAENGEVEVQLDLMNTREWTELGSKILILEGRSKDRSGLEGFVGKVVEIAE